VHPRVAKARARGFLLVGRDGIMTTITPEIREAINKSAGEPARVEDPETHRVYVLLDEETYHQLRQLKDIDRSDLSLQEFEDFQPLP
jgi:hypothetical protein